MCIGFDYEEEARICSCCNKEMWEGFCIDDGREYYCNEECLYKVYDRATYEEMYEEGCAYWTEWEQPSYENERGL